MATINFDDKLADGINLLPFQTVTTAYALATRRCMIGDEMGLGKTISALTALETDGAFPALVVCPASLKGNWEREVSKFVPWRTVQVISGRGKPGLVFNADIIVVNYDVLASWDDYLPRNLKAVVADESHYLKSRDAQRTRAMLRIAKRLPENALRLCLTGTPILNRPKELVTQLQVLDRLRDVAPRPKKDEDERDWEFSFLFTFCGPANEGHGWSFDGASNLDLLNDALRSTCFVRHARTDVTDLKATDRVPVSLSLNGALKEYRAAEKDLIGWLRKNKGDDVAQSAFRAEGLARINYLRQLSASAKLGATFEWIDNFFDSYPDASLIVFAHHRDVQKALVEHYNCASIMGGASVEDTEAAKAAFQAGDERLIVCSLSAAREGHTLTRAHDVLFVETPWHPGAFDQAADRANRIGQTADVTAWVLLNEETIDWRLWNIIESKRAVFNAAIEGNGHDDTKDEAVAMLLLGQYAS